jgi:hypothetical protein
METNETRQQHFTGKIALPRVPHQVISGLACIDPDGRRMHRQQPWSGRQTRNYTSHQGLLAHYTINSKASPSCSPKHLHLTRTRGNCQQHFRDDTYYHELDSWIPSTEQLHNVRSVGRTDGRHIKPELSGNVCKTYARSAEKLSPGGDIVIDRRVCRMTDRPGVNGDKRLCTGCQ